MNFPSVSNKPVSSGPASFVRLLRKGRHKKRLSSIPRNVHISYANTGLNIPFFWYSKVFFLDSAAFYLILKRAAEEVEAVAARKQGGL